MHLASSRAFSQKRACIKYYTNIYAITQGGFMSNILTYIVGNGLYINITNRCPCECTFCIRNNKDGINFGESLWLATEPTLAEIILAIDNANLASYDEVVFCGYGEPTERLDVLLKIAEYIKLAHPTKPTRLNTNGLSDLINGKKTAILLATHINSISISLNAPNKSDYIKLCHPAFGDKSFDAIIEFAKDANLLFNETVLTVVDVLGAEKIAQCEQLCAELGIKMRVRKIL